MQSNPGGFWHYIICQWFPEENFFSQWIMNVQEAVSSKIDMRANSKVFNDKLKENILPYPGL